MLDKILNLKNGNNSVKEFTDCIRQGIPSAVFGVTDAFKNYLLSKMQEFPFIRNTKYTITME